MLVTFWLSCQISCSLATLENVDILNAFALVPFENSGSFNMVVNKDYGEVYLSEDHKAVWKSN